MTIRKSQHPENLRFLCVSARECADFIEFLTICKIRYAENLQFLCTFSRKGSENLRFSGMPPVRHSFSIQFLATCVEQRCNYHELFAFRQKGIHFCRSYVRLRKVHVRCYVKPYSQVPSLQRVFFNAHIYVYIYIYDKLKKPLAQVPYNSDHVKTIATCFTRITEA